MSKSDVKTYDVIEAAAARAKIGNAEYEALYEASVADPDAFWAEHGHRIEWSKAVHQGDELHLRVSGRLDPLVRGRRDERVGQLHRPAPRDARGDRTAILWEGDDPADDARDHLSRAARPGLPAGQRDEGAWASSKGDRVTLYLPMVPEAAYAMLACARIGAVHSIVFGGFSPDALAGNASPIAARTSSSRPTRAYAAASGCR